MRGWAISCFILVGCGHADAPLDIVRLPQSAYGPFDAAASRAVAPSDAGADAASKTASTTQVECFVPGELDEDENTADAPFDNCPMKHEGNRFNEKATSQRRTRANRDTCCYSVVHRSKVITIPEVD
jgi:hypothetical protein